jgi:hypothetical protein
MNQVQSESDFWLITTGNAFLHTFVDYDMQNGVNQIPVEECQACGEQTTADKFASTTQPACPKCGGTALTQVGTQNTPIGRPTTIALSPLEVAFPNNYARFDDLPYVVRLRWRSKTYYENHPQLKLLVPQIKWAKTPTDPSMLLFKSLATHNDLGIAPIYWSEGSSTAGHEEGISEYEIWYKPCDAYPDGLVFRVIGEQAPLIVHLEETEALPGPLPYKDASGQPLFTFAHAGYEHVGGRILASGPLDVIIQKQDQLNQLDSMILLIIMRMANPVWIWPKGAEPTKMTGMPGLVIEYSALALGGQAKPERLAGIGPDASLFTIREQYLKDIEELAGTFDIIKGAKPTGVEAFSALQLLVERSQSRFATVFTARGDAYRQWYQFALELEREFGPDERTKFMFTPARSWMFENFKRSQLVGSLTVIVEDGTNTPKTSLGMRAAVEHASQLGMLNMQDPDQQYEGLKLFGLTKMVPTLDIHVQSALQKQQAFEQWAANPQVVAQTVMGYQQKLQMVQQQVQQQTAQYQQQVAQSTDPNQALPPEPTLPPMPSATEGTPLQWLPWYQPVIHKQEFMKWANGDRIRQLLKEVPMIQGLLAAHLNDINQALMQEQGLAAGPVQALPPGGAGAAMANSNRESTQGNEPKGQGQGAQNAGPR